MNMFLPVSVMNLVAWIASPVESQSRLAPLQSLVMPLPTNYSAIHAFENMNVTAHCDPPMEHHSLYQYNLQTARQLEDTRHTLQAGQEAGLIEQETVAIFGYTLFDYSLLNPIAWGADSVSFQAPWPTTQDTSSFSTCTLSRADVWPEIEVLAGALSKLPPAQPLNATLWRGSGQTPEELGRVVTGGFSSTTRNFDRVLVFAPGRNTLWAIESHISGKDIANFSRFGSEEEEVLFPMGSRLEVVECSPTTVDDEKQKKIDSVAPSVTVLCMKEVPAETVLV